MDGSKRPTKYWHCRVKLTRAKDYAVVNDLTFDELERTIVRPWNSGRPFTVAGTVVRSASDVSEIRIEHTEYPQDYYAREHNSSMRSSGIVDMATDRRQLPFSRGTDATFELLFSEAGKKQIAERHGTHVFIGHGRSKVWRELKDFVQDRLGLSWDEFNRVPVAGLTNIARLSEMLNAAAIALLVLTAEDEMADGGVQARMNIIHEAGLFQGRLGFTKAIVLLEEGCTEFSNIQGLGQIRFPRGNIAASFEEIRRVLEREDLLSKSS